MVRAEHDRTVLRSIAVWPKLARQTRQNSTLGASSLIPLNHSFVVPGGRFREN